jgi:predicted nucleic acid-binding protein
MRVALDSNVLVYAEGINDDARRRIAQDVLVCLRDRHVSVPAQAIAELFSVLVRKGRRPAAKARSAVTSWTTILNLVPTSAEIIAQALQIAEGHSLQIFDAIILAAAADAQCHLLLSEDLQHGFTWGGVTVVNPFLSTPHPMLTAALRDSI